MNTNKLLILAAVGVGAYLLLTKSANAATPGGARPGTYSPIYPAGYGAPTAANTPRAQMDALNNSTLYGVGRLINGMFGGNAGNAGGVPMGTTPSAVAIGSGGGQYRPSNDFGMLTPAPTYYTPGTYSVDPNSWGPFNTTDGMAVNPPGGYDVYTPGSYSVDPNAWGPPNPANYDAYDFQ